MNDNPKDPAHEANSAESLMTPKTSSATTRRRLLKGGLGLAPVVLTLASRPVLAWHCKSPSAWGSEQLNPTTSLSANQGHESYVDVTWTISNWKNNTERQNLGKPWVKLGYTNGNWKQVTLRMLQGRGVTIPSGVDVDIQAYQFFESGTIFQKTVVVAQLNGLLLPSVTKCISIAELKEMATGRYNPPYLSVTWYENDILLYLDNNWIVKP